MKTNSKLYKRVLAIALAVCMLCSVLVTGIGVGLEAKAASAATLSFYFQASGYWPDASKSETVTGNGTYNFDLDVSSFAGKTGLQNACIEITDFDDSETPDAVDFSSVSITVDGTEYYSYDYAGTHWDTGLKTVTTNAFADAFADYTWTGNEKVLATVTVTGLSFTADGGDDNTGDDNTGDDNTGDDNTGDDNTGDDNTGDDNTGDDNTGETTSYNATLNWAAAPSWNPSAWDHDPQTINGPGTYTFTYNGSSGDSGAAFLVVVVDSPEAPKGIKVSSASVIADGETVYTGGVWEWAQDGKYRYVFVDGKAILDASALNFSNSLVVKLTYVGENENPAYGWPEEFKPSTEEDPGEGGESTGNAYLAVTDCWWSVKIETPQGTTANVTGPGSYTVGVTGAGHEGAAFMALYVNGGESFLKDYAIKIKSIKVNGSSIAFGTGYTCSDDGSTTRVNIYNEWATPKKGEGDVRVPVGTTKEISAIIINNKFGDWTDITVDFDVVEATSDDADIVYPGEGDSEEDSEDTEETPEGIVPNDNGYYHDRGAIFVYTGSKYNIHDFVLYGGVCLEEQVKDGTYYKWSNDWSELSGKGVYIKYWDDYKGIGYPAIQLSWRTEMTEFLGTCIRSADWTYNDYNSYSNFFDKGNNVDGSNRWYYFGEGSYESAEDTTEDTTTTQNPVPTTDGVVNVTGDGEYYTFLAIGADNNASDWYYSWAGLKPEEEDETNKIPDGITVEAVNAKIGEQFTISVKTETPVAYTWYVAPTIIVGADKTNVDAEIVAVRIDGKDVTDTIDFKADDKTWWYEDTGLFTKANNDNKDVAARLAGGFNEWGTKYFAESPAGYTSIEYDIIINGVA